nr:probable lactoylglutathione lyase, chloroplastic [Ipomoea batatas]
MSRSSSYLGDCPPNSVASTIDLVKVKGGKVTQEPGPVKIGSTAIAYVEDPDGYPIELLERSPTPEPLCQVMLRVGDLDRAVNFYKKCTIAIMGYSSEDKNVVVELPYNYGVKEYYKGNGYAQIAIGTNDVYKTAEVIKLCGGEITREPGSLPGINTKIIVCVDPDGWKAITSCPSCSCGCRLADLSTKSCISSLAYQNNYRDHWRVKLTISNYNYGRNYSDWTPVVQHPSFSQTTTTYNFNNTMLLTTGVRGCEMRTLYSKCSNNSFIILKLSVM